MHPPLQNPKYASDVNMPSQTKWRNVGSKTSTFFIHRLQTFLFFVTFFFTFLTFLFFFSGTFFIHLCMHVRMDKCGHLYTNIPYSKHCLHWIQISCHSQSQSQSHSHISGSAYFSSVIGDLSTASTSHTHDTCQFLMRIITLRNWPKIKIRRSLRIVGHKNK